MPDVWTLIVYSLLLYPFEAEPASRAYDELLDARVEIATACAVATDDQFERFTCMKVARFESSYRPDVASLPESRGSHRVPAGGEAVVPEPCLGASNTPRATVAIKFACGAVSSLFGGSSFCEHAQIATSQRRFMGRVYRACVALVHR